MKKARFISFNLYSLFVLLNLFVLLCFFVHVLTVSYNMYKTQKNACRQVHLQIDALYSFH